MVDVDCQTALVNSDADPYAGALLHRGEDYPLAAPVQPTLSLTPIQSMMLSLVANILAMSTTLTD